MRKVIRVDEQGFLIEDILINDNDYLPENCIEISCPDGFYKPKWDGKSWVEGLTQEEIQALIPIPEPTLEDYLLDLDYRVSMIELGL